MSDASRLLNAIQHGDAHAAAALLPLVYDELRRLAEARLLEERPGQTLSATALVHEAYLRLVGPAGANDQWQGRGHFFAAAAQAMRRILIDEARRKRRLKHGGGLQRVSLDDVDRATGEAEPDVLALDEALGQFAVVAPLKARLVELRYFAGLSVEEAAACLGISRATADRWWTYTRAWLKDFLQNGGISEKE